MTECEDNQSNDNELANSLDSECGGFDVPIMRTPRVKKALVGTNEKTLLLH